MKKILITLAVFLSAAISFGQTVVVTGHPVTAQGTTSSNGTSILFELKNTSTQQCRVAGTGLITPTSFTVTQAQLAAGINIYPNSSIVCGTSTGNTRWLYTVKAAGIGVAGCSLNITTTTNLDSTACLNATSTPVTAAPTDSVFCKIDGSNCGFTGAVTDTVSFGAPLFNVTGSLNATIANDTAGGINLTPNSGKTWEVANGGSLSSPPGGAVQFNGSGSGLITVNAPAAAGANNLTLPAATDTLVGKSTTDILSNKTIPTAGLAFAGSASGSTTIKGGSAASGTATLPVGSGTIIEDGLTQTMSSKTLATPFQGLNVTDTITSPIVFSVHSLLNTATNSGNFAVANAVAGTYEVGGYIYVSTAGTSGTVGLSFAYNNGANQAINSAGNANINTLGSNATIPTQIIQIAANTTFGWGATVTTGIGTFKYDVHLIMRRIN